MESINSNISIRNAAILDGFYNSEKRFVTKEDLINSGFDFSEFFSTSELKHFFDVGENAFEYKDFRSGKYYIKTRDKNIEKPSEHARLFFQIILVDFSGMEKLLSLTIQSLRERKYTAGAMWAYQNDSEMYNAKSAEVWKGKYDLSTEEVQKIIPQVDTLITNLNNTCEIYKDLLLRLRDERAEERWL
jgi:hypothetical protein